MSNSETKPRIGFRTAAAELQDKFEEIFSKAQLTEDSWVDVRESWEKIGEKLVNWRGGKSSEEFSMLLSLLELSVLIGRVQAVAGKQLTNIEKRVVALEKSIEKLHLKVK